MSLLISHKNFFYADRFIRPSLRQARGPTLITYEKKIHKLSKYIVVAFCGANIAKAEHTKLRRAIEDELALFIPNPTLGTPTYTASNSLADICQMYDTEILVGTREVVYLIGQFIDSGGAASLDVDKCKTCILPDTVPYTYAHDGMAIVPAIFFRHGKTAADIYNFCDLYAHDAVVSKEFDSFDRNTLEPYPVRKAAGGK